MKISKFLKNICGNKIISLKWKKTSSSKSLAVPKKIAVSWNKKPSFQVNERNAAAIQHSIPEKH
jgi:hypothetical protein